MQIRIVKAGFDPGRELADHQATTLRRGEYGANAVFIGSMRDFNEGSQVHSMTLEYYPGMTEKHIEQICHTAAQRWSLQDVLVIHRVGDICPGDPIVLVSVWSAHRGDAFDACRFIMEDLKHTAPFWKKESLDSGERWVDQNTDGYAINSTN